MPQETELKFRVDEAAGLRQKLRARGFRVTRKRTREQNWLFDNAGGSLRAEGKILRLRRLDDTWLLTAKGPRQPGVLKRRREEQTYVREGARCRALLEMAGFRVVGRYAVTRTLLGRAGESGEIAWDETAKGIYLEIEGAARWVRSTAGELGLRPEDAEPRSYPELLLAHAGRGIEH